MRRIEKLKKSILKGDVYDFKCLLHSSKIKFKDILGVEKKLKRIENLDYSIKESPLFMVIERSLNTFILEMIEKFTIKLMCHEILRHFFGKFSVIMEALHSYVQKNRRTGKYSNIDKKGNEKVVDFCSSYSLSNSKETLRFLEKLKKKFNEKIDTIIEKYHIGIHCLLQTETAEEFEKRNVIFRVSYNNGIYFGFFDPKKRCISRNGFYIYSSLSEYFVGKIKERSMKGTIVFLHGDKKNEFKGKFDEVEDFPNLCGTPQRGIFKYENGDVYNGEVVLFRRSTWKETGEYFSKKHKIRIVSQFRDDKLSEEEKFKVFRGEKELEGIPKGFKFKNFYTEEEDKRWIDYPEIFIKKYRFDVFLQYLGGLDRHYGVDYYNRTNVSVFNMFYKNDLKKVKILVENQGFDVNKGLFFKYKRLERFNSDVEQEFYPINIAVENRHPELVKFLLGRKEVDLNKRNYRKHSSEGRGTFHTPLLSFAFGTRNFEIIEEILKHHKKINFALESVNIRGERHVDYKKVPVEIIRKDEKMFLCFLKSGVNVRMFKYYWGNVHYFHYKYPNFKKNCELYFNRNIHSREVYKLFPESFRKAFVCLQLCVDVLPTEIVFVIMNFCPIDHFYEF